MICLTQELQNIKVWKHPDLLGLVTNITEYLYH